MLQVSLFSFTFPVCYNFEISFLTIWFSVSILFFLSYWKFPYYGTKSVTTISELSESEWSETVFSELELLWYPTVDLMLVSYTWPEISSTSKRPFLLFLFYSLIFEPFFTMVSAVVLNIDKAAIFDVSAEFLVSLSWEASGMWCGVSTSTSAFSLTSTTFSSFAFVIC